jgi:hypothetical protein
MRGRVGGIGGHERLVELEEQAGQKGTEMGGEARM